jgi:thiol-disulfide isomerase/thioredoxin
MKRRTALMAGAGAAAAVAGATLSWWHSRPQPPAAGAEAAALWDGDHRFPRPEGGELALAALRGRPLVLNFWATWCPPCVREMPQLSRFAREFGPQGWQVAGLAADQAEPVQRFLQRTPVDFPIGLAGMAAVTLSRDLGNTAGALPFTVVFDATGRIVQQRLGETSYDELAQWARQMHARGA